MIRRELTFKPGDLYQRSLVQDSQRRLYGMELFQFANIEPLEPGAAARRGADARDGRGRQAPARELRRRLRHGRKGARRRRIPPPEFPRRRAHRPACTRAGRRSIAASASISTSRTSSARTSRSAAKAQQLVHRTRRPTARSSTGAQGDADAPAAAQRTSWSVSMTSERDSSSIADDVLDDPDAAQRPDRARPRSDAPASRAAR